MARVHGKDTAPELFVRQTAHSLGYRFRIHRADLPGRPDMVFPSRKKVIFIHGCFWHRHKECKRASVPQTRQEYWLKKFALNVARDKLNVAALIEAGWEVLVLWECGLRNRDSVVRELRTFLEAPTSECVSTPSLTRACPAARPAPTLTRRGDEVLARQRQGRKYSKQPGRADRANS